MQATAPIPTRRVILRKPEVQRRVPVHDSTRWRWERDGRFPKRVQIGPNSVGWFEDEIETWLQERERK